jgi:MOSC domain-containing protein YiiM
MPLNENSHLAQLMNNYAQKGRVEWIGIRPDRGAEVLSVNEVEAIEGKGLEGDHYQGKNGSRQITLIQYEHLPVIASMLNLQIIDPGFLRRNIAVKGLNILSMKDKQFKIGEAVIEMTGLCHPCSRMEQTLGLGGYNAMRGHGGITAKIIKSGTIRLGDFVSEVK